MPDWADKARVELDDKHVCEIFVSDTAEDGLVLRTGLHPEAAHYLRNNFIPRARVERMIKHVEGIIFKNRGHYIATELLVMLLEEQDD